MVDVQERDLGRRKPNGRRIKSSLLHNLVGESVTVEGSDGQYSRSLQFNSGGLGNIAGFYVGERRIAISEVYRVHSESKQIKLYINAGSCK